MHDFISLSESGATLSKSCSREFKSNWPFVKLFDWQWQIGNLETLRWRSNNPTFFSHPAAAPARPAERGRHRRHRRQPQNLRHGYVGAAAQLGKLSSPVHQMARLKSGHFDSLGGLCKSSRRTYNYFDDKRHDHHPPG
jgi:hypothetical protein